MARDVLQGHGLGATDAASFGFAISPSDTVDEAVITRGIYVGVAGDVVAILDNKSKGSGQSLTFKNVIAGTILPIRARRVDSTNTTATNMIGLY